MSTRLRTRYQSGRIFLLSGFSDDSRKDLGKKIQQLGSIVLNIDYFRSNCTHVVCGQLSRSEKYLGACATGKWLLHPDYIIHSVEKKEWLLEEKYEWNNYSCPPNISLSLKDAPSRWRRQINSTQLCAFSDWKVAVVVGNERSIIYKRLLVSGGAEVYNIKLPVKNLAKVANVLTYLFVSSANAGIVAPLQDYGVLCLKPSYIGDYLIQNPPPDPFNYIVITGETNGDLSQLDLESTPSCRTSGSQSSCTSCAHVATGSTHSTPDAKLVNRVLKSALGRSSSLELDHNPETPVILPSHSTAAKRKIFDNSDLEWSYREVKKQKFHHVPCNWKPSVLSVPLCYDDTQEPDTAKVTCQLSSQLTRMIQVCMEERFDHPALDLTLSCLSAKFCPQALTLHTIITSVLQPAKTKIIANKAFGVLRKVLHLHPPMNPILQSLYLEVLRCPLAHNGDTENQGEEWEFILHVIELVLDQRSTKPEEGDAKVFTQSQDNNLMLLEFLVAILEHNFQHFLLRIKGDKSPVRLHGCMLAKVLWFPRYQVQMNGRCKELLRVFSSALESKLPQLHKNQLIKLIMGLISMAAVICSIIEVGMTEDILHFLRSRTAEVFIHECARKIQYTAVDGEKLRHFLSCLQPPWFCLAVCQQILHTLDDYLVYGNPPARYISLRLIVSRYFFLLPKLKNSRNLKSADASIQDELPLHDNVKIINKMNKRNYKGETVLHTACIKNDVSKLEEALMMPGIDVNIKDNAGWTPLHEACNHGNLKCVMRLLYFVPAKTNDSTVAQDFGSCKKVDLLATSLNGVTPLHDAVLSNKLEICELLLEHGGHEQLKAKTILGYTPLDLAYTPCMKTLLLSVNSPPSTQSSTSSTTTKECRMRDEFKEIKSPIETMYEKIMGSGEDRLHTDRQDCVKYINTVSYILRSYLECTDIIRLKDALTPDTIEALLYHQSNKDESVEDNKENTTMFQQRSECSGVGSKALLRDDLFILRDMRKHLEKFRKHLLKISSEIDVGLIDAHCRLLHCLMKT